MKISLILLLCISIHSFAQNDTIELIDFEYSDCDRSIDPGRIQQRIIDQLYIGDIFKIEVGVRAPCCVDFIPDILFENDTLYLKFTTTGERCDCGCCYKFVYYVSGLKNKKFGVKIRNQPIVLSDEIYRTYPNSYEVIDGDTINRKDKYGLKQGKWITQRTMDDRKIDRNAFYIDNQIWEATNFSFYHSGIIRSVSIYKRGLEKKRITYYENGNEKLKTVWTDDGKDYLEYILWREDGTIVRQKKK